MPLLDFFANPNVALAAGLLSPTPNQNFGQGLLQGINAGQTSNALNNRSNIATQALADESGFRESLQGLPQGALLGLQPQNAGQLNAVSGLLNTLRPPKPPTSEFERLDALVQSGQATPGQIARHARLTSESGGLNVNLQGLFEGQKARTQGANFAKAEATAVEKAGKVRAFEGATNELLRGLAAGAPIGTVASLIGGADVVRSQFNQAVQSEAALEDQISGLSSENQDEMRGLIARAVAGNEAASQTLSLVYLLAGSRETGKLSDTDLKLSKDSIESGSVEGMVAKLVSTRNGQIASFNAEQKINRERVGDSIAFAPMEGEKVFTVEGIRNAPDSVIQGFRSINPIALKKMLSKDEKEELVKRLRGMQNAN